MGVSSKKLEVCAESVESALIAQTEGAYRVELCGSLIEGGTTPSYAQIKIAREKLSIKLYVIIRPRGGNFLYNGLEFDIMKEDIHKCGEIGCNGIVIGILHADGSIDKSRTAQLVAIAKSYSMGVTFHRAFDVCNDLFIGLNDVIETGCERILTSGGKSIAPEGTSVIKKLIELAGDRIIVMPGSGLTPENIVKVAKSTNAMEFHGTFKESTSFRTDPKKVQNALMAIGAI